MAARPLGPQLPRDAAAGPRRSQGRADYAFFQHILTSLDPTTGRCAVLFPHGVLFRNEEAEMRRKLIELDLLECVLGLGPNLFYNSPMEACVVVCRTRKPSGREGKVLFIDAVHDVARERAQSFLKAEHQQRILTAYQAFTDDPGFAKVATAEEILQKDGNLSIPRHVRPLGNEPRTRNGDDIKAMWASFETSGREFWQRTDALVDMLDGVATEETSDA